MLMASLAINAQRKSESYDWNKVINAIAMVESKGNASAKSKDCVGLLQIRPVLVNDCNEYLKLKKSNKRYTLKDRLNPNKSKEMFILYQKRYNPTNNIEKAIRLWNGGCGYSKAKTENYYRKVMKYYNGGS
ncbi:MAG: lytic transglycosylase domain-containing protein [Bacilli bacterium]|nr:lytic transglycosylase domain-containing protein [Bacilli bacterium]